MAETNLTEQELREKYGKLYTVAIDIEVDDSTTEHREYLFKKPTAVSFDRFVKRVSTSSYKAAEDFVKDSVIDEQMESLETDIDDFPAIVLTINEKLTNMLGLAKDVSVKKF